LAGSTKPTIVGPSTGTKKKLQRAEEGTEAAGKPKAPGEGEAMAGRRAGPQGDCAWASPDELGCMMRVPSG